MVDSRWRGPNREVFIKDHPHYLKRQGIAPRHSFQDFIAKIEGRYVEPRKN